MDFFSVWDHQVLFPLFGRVAPVSETVPYKRFGWHCWLKTVMVVEGTQETKFLHSFVRERTPWNVNSETDYLWSLFRAMSKGSVLSIDWENLDDF
jgi:hypothetical protein